MSKENNQKSDNPPKLLLKGLLIMFVSLYLFTVILTTVLTTPDPEHKINYSVFILIESALLLTFFWGLNFLDKLFVMLINREKLKTKGVVDNKCLVKNSTEE